ncbi:hypothetical protein EGW08_001977, partial [Elysia chlorotica]
KNYHVLGGANQEFGDLPTDERESTHTPVMVLPVRRPGLAAEEEFDDYDDDDDDLMVDTPGRSRLVAAKQSLFGEDALCPVTRLPGIAEDIASNDRSVDGSVVTTTTIAAPGGGNNNIVFVCEDGTPLPPRTPTPPHVVETVRDKDSKLRVFV